MENSKTIETINKFYSIIETQDASKESREFMLNFELEMAKSMLNEFSDESNRRLAQILLLFLDCDWLPFIFTIYLIILVFCCYIHP